MSGKYILHVDGRPVQVLGSLDEAKEAGAARLSDAHTLTIECPAAPAPTAIWRYEPEVSDWVQTA